MTFTREQIETLSTWEENFRTAIKAQWARNPGREALKTIYDIYTTATGDGRRFNDNCNHCILSLLKDCGDIYYRDIEEMAATKARKAKEVGLSRSSAKPVRKAVKTARKKEA